VTESKVLIRLRIIVLEVFMELEGVKG